MLTQIHEIFLALESAYRWENRPGGDEAADSLFSARFAEMELAEKYDAPLSLLDRAAKQPQSLSIASTIRDCSRYFHWDNWAQDILDSEISSNLYTTELIGPDGLLTDPTVRIGLLVSAQNTDYPISRHSGEETYFVISGTAQWTCDGGPYKPVKPGALVHHPSWAPHGRRTENEIFLGAWRWSGELDLESFSIDNVDISGNGSDA